MFVTAKPRWFLRADGLVVLAISLGAFWLTNQPWWLYPLVLFAPDVTMAGYLRGNRFGASCYNIGHSYPAPALTITAGWLITSHLAVAIGVIWFGHVGLDRALGFGLKYDEGFDFTHLGRLGSSRRERPVDDPARPPSSR